MPQDGLLCWSCGRPTGNVDRILRTDQCPDCKADLHTCRGCRHFDPSRKFQCREQIDSPVGNKEMANYCEWFSARDAMKGSSGMKGTSDARSDKKKRFDDLFND